MIRIVDYGLGNVSAFFNAYKRANIDVGVARTVDDIRRASRLVLPGVGAFDHAMTMLHRSGMRDAMEERVLGERVPVLGVCVGMQMMARRSDEGKLPGLGWINAEVRSFSAMGLDDLRLPHMGWNDVIAGSGAPLFTGLDSFARFYFLHSYYLDGVRSGDMSAIATYGRDFCCAVGVGNINGVQFHPEKSHDCGMQLLKNFAEH
jgi:glutamine amidotransferase